MNDILDRIQPTDAQAQHAALERQRHLTKPLGALGDLEELSVRLAAVFGSPRPHPRGVSALVCAGDHGVTLEGVSAYPREVTVGMVANFLAGGAAVNAVARTVGARVRVINAGVDAELPDHPDLINRPVRRGTRNLLHEPALTREEALAAVRLGAAAAAAEIESGADLLVPGEMGIGNTTPAAAITARLLGLPAAAVTGRGTGVSDEALSHKVTVVQRALARAASEPTDPLGVLADLGGLEIAAMVGVILEGAARRRAVIIDGYIATAAALVAARLAPNAGGYLFASHLSAEPGHALQLEALGLTPLLRLNMRLGEGSGGVMCAPLLLAAAATLREMATFEEAGLV
ncbi:nicotinate-nucleotide--dimethylbenzimidazole phosphoribosyltransferase [Deinobacterium chartae]|uniref:Nicotinate-nucleotide--dimethylbenzimidazole phosphoribosyltransferase n=1 Tax=Deinobacterium chartae TaxID=521158 RepID=A0A841I0W8_9DEIO|nr:nicotinate-nucleotide--dimethylbenzimidazole phosphoribosyltransferase [Deinobacterium chartae]MBB6097742.1 nicotinate-nucleotide--dimethylbenzimidazole phosphoribosyltransferase [Deinobacterium chartae]